MQEVDISNVEDNRNTKNVFEIEIQLNILS